VLARAEIKVACLDRNNFKPVSMPKFLGGSIQR
jgi:acyl-CoA thioesterase FadM